MQDPLPNRIERQVEAAPRRLTRPARIAGAAAFAAVLALAIYVSTQPVGSFFGSGPSSPPDASAPAQGDSGEPAPDFVTADGSDALARPR